MLYGAKFLNQTATSNKPHIFGFNTARTAANDDLMEWWNGATSAGIKAAIDKDGKLYSAALTAGDILYAVAGGITGVKRLDSLGIGTANQVLRVNAGATAPEWASTLSGLTLTSPTITGTGAAAFSTVTTSGLITANAGVTVASGQTLTLTGATITGFSGNITGNCSGTAATVTGATQTAITTCANLTTIGTLVAGAVPASLVTAGTFPAGSFSMPTLAVTSGLTLTGATITGAPTWSSTQTMNITGNASGTAATVTGATQASITTCSNLTTIGTLFAGAVPASLVSAGTFSGSFVFSSKATAHSLKLTDGEGIHRDTSDGSDNSYLQLCGGGAVDGTRGAWILLQGNEANGQCHIHAGGVAGGNVGIYDKNLVEVARFDESATSGNTRFLVFDNDNGTLERVTVGAPDSGGSGYKLLRIPN